MIEAKTPGTSYSKIFLALGIALGNYIPYTVLMVFSTQLYKHLDFANIGYYILALTSFSGALMCLISPGLVLTFGSKRSIILGSFGLSYFQITLGHG